MRSRIDAARQSRRDDQTGARQISCKGARKFAAERRRIAGTDDSHHLPLQDRDMAENRDNRWRRISGSETTRKFRLAGCEHASAKLVQRGDLTIDVVSRRYADAFAAAALDEAGQRFERRFGGAVPFDQLRKCHCADILRARQAQPCVPLRVRKSPAHAGGLFAPIRGSSPCNRRRMFERCAMNTSTARMTARKASWLLPNA